jgi:hypothetical protein
MLMVLQPAITLSLFDKHPGGVDPALKCVGLVELASRPKLDGSQPQRKTLFRHYQAGMHQEYN